MSQQTLAELIGVDQPTISRIESGRDVSSIMLARIAQVTGQDFDFFLRAESMADMDALLLRDGGAEAPAIERAVAQLSRFVRDYEFLLDLK
jgi:transcriptional regulator with XRE-family HTH domain